MRADLLDVGVDLREWLIPSRGAALLEVIEQMPPACRWREAVANDPDQARLHALAEQSGLLPDAPEWSPPLREYDLVAQQLGRVIDLLGAIGAGLRIFSTAPEFPRPRTALDRARAEALLATRAEIDALLVPHMSGT